MAGRYPPQWLDDLRARADIVQIVGSYVPLKRNGHRYIGLCPFHNEKTPSFSVDEQKQLYYCFGCKAGGSVIQFIMEIERLSFQEAVAMLAEQLRMPLPEMQNDPEWEKRRSLKERIYLANKAAAQEYHRLLWQPQGAEVLAYLKKRGLSDAVIRRFGIGASANPASVGQTLMKQGFTQEELVSAGLMLQKEGRAFDMFRARAMFPIIDAYGNVLGFGGRAMGAAQPKYLNTSDTPAFNKRYHVYAANLLRKAKALSRVILVEGYMDVVALSQYGVEGVAATLGTALTPDQARLLSRYAPEVWIAYDGDSAGQHAILRGLEILEGEHVPVRVLDFPGGLDPDEFIRQEGVEAFQRLKPITGTTYRLLRLKEQYELGSEDGRIAYAKAAAEVLRTVREPVELDNHLKKLSMETGIERDVLWRQIGVEPPKQHTQGVKREGFTQKAKAVAEIDWNARTLLAALSTGKLPKDSVSADEFTDPTLRSLCEALLAGHSPAELMESQPDDAGRAAVGDILSINTDMSDDELRQMARDCVTKMRRTRLEGELDSIQQSLPNLDDNERAKETARAMLLMRQLNELK